MTDKNIEVKFETTANSTEERWEGDIYYGGIGEYLRVILVDESGKRHTLFSGQVRGTGRYGDDFKHWYNEVEKIEEIGDKIYVTLNSGLLRDTYVLNRKDTSVKLVESIDLEELKKQKKINSIKSGLEGKVLEEIMDDVGKILLALHKSEGTRDPYVAGKAIDKEQGIGVSAIAIYRPGYDPMVSELRLYAVKRDSSIQELEPIEFEGYRRPKDTSTFFRKKELNISKNKVYISGKIIQYSYSGFPGTRTTELDSIEEIREINPDGFRKLEEILN